jgi:CxxC motif-containing protein (DUF1111 family)
VHASDDLDEAGAARVDDSSLLQDGEHRRSAAESVFTAGDDTGDLTSERLHARGRIFRRLYSDAKCAVMLHRFLLWAQALEHEPPEATIHNVGRLTTPLFGLGLVDAMPDSFFDSLASAEPSNIRGIANRVSIVLPNPTDASQSLNGTRVGRFGWKAGVATLTQFAADAYVNEMGITTQHCIKGTSVTAFATESQPNGIAQPAGCDDLAPPQPAGNGVPAGTDDAVGSCAGGKTEIQDDVGEFAEFMTFLAPPPRGAITAAVTRGQTNFSNAGCAGCHVLTTFKTPATTGNGVPGNFAFNPFSDFLVHDMDTLGDHIGNYGHTVPVTRRMRTAPLWGLRFRTLFLHDGRTSNLTTAITAHAGQGAAAATAFNNLSATQKSDLIAFLQSL